MTNSTGYLAIATFTHAADAVNTWDKQDINKLVELLSAYRDACDEAEFDVQHGGVDMATLPSAELPADIDTSLPVWAMDIRGNMLVGDAAVETMTMAEYRESRAE